MFGVAVSAKKLTVNILRLRTHALNFALTFRGLADHTGETLGSSPLWPSVCLHVSHFEP